MSDKTQFSWLIEAPGPNYLYVRTIGLVPDFAWTKDHNKALPFVSQEQADTTMMAIRGLAPALFGFAVTLGDAKPVEHGWLVKAAASDAAGREASAERVRIDRQKMYDAGQEEERAFAVAWLRANLTDGSTYGAICLHLAAQIESGAHRP